MGSMKKKMKKLSTLEITALKNKFEPLKFSNTFHIVYENHIPQSGVLLIDGHATLTKSQKSVQQVEPGTILGVLELVNEEPVEYGCKLEKDSEVILLQKSDIKEEMNNKTSVVAKIIYEAKR